MNVRGMFNGWGAKALFAPISIPNAELAIDTGEDLKPQAMKVEYQNPRQFVVVTQPTSYEKSQIDMNSKPIDESTLQKDYWFGDPRGSI